MSDTFQVPPGVVAVTTYGAIRAETVQSMLDMRGHAAKMGLTNLNWIVVNGSLVDKARNEAVLQMFRAKADWLWFLDADMRFDPNLIEVMLTTAFASESTRPFDIVGGWCPLRGEPYLPTIDTGTGTWEPHDANCGPVEVIRTGAACLLVKRHVFERMEFPWFGVRAAARPLDMLAEIDNYARIKFDGRNPFSGLSEWGQLQQCAVQDAQAQRARAGSAPLPDWKLGSVGEDSNFSDKARALGFRIVVNTDAVCEHVEYRSITPAMHVQCFKDAERKQASLTGVLL